MLRGGDQRCRIFFVELQQYAGRFAIPAEQHQRLERGALHERMVRIGEHDRRTIAGDELCRAARQYESRLRVATCMLVPIVLLTPFGAAVDVRTGEEVRWLDRLRQRHRRRRFYQCLPAVVPDMRSSAASVDPHVRAR